MDFFVDSADFTEKSYICNIIPRNGRDVDESVRLNARLYTFLCNDGPRSQAPKAGTMFSNIAAAFLISLGIALVVLLVVKGLYARFSPELLHLLVAGMVVAGSTVACASALTGSKALKYVNYLEKSAKGITGQVDAAAAELALDRYGISAKEIADGYVSDAASLAKSKLKKTRTLSVIIMVVLNLLLLLFLLNAGSKAASYHKSRSSSLDDELDDFDNPGSSSFDDDFDC